MRTKHCLIFYKVKMQKTQINNASQIFLRLQSILLRFKSLNYLGNCYMAYYYMNSLEEFTTSLYMFKNQFKN